MPHLPPSNNRQNNNYTKTTNPPLWQHVMDTDPWTWSVADVQHFFQHDALRLIADRPSGQLPPLAAFVQQLGENDVDGASLLDSLDATALRNDFGITSFRHRGSVQHCIRKLQSRSQSYRSGHTDLRPQTPTSLLATPILPAAVANPATVLPSTEPVGENVRQGEVQVQDLHGRKRRKLDFGQLKTAEPQKVQSTPAATGFLADTAAPVDELFYGSAGFGHVVGELPPPGNIFVEHDHSESADDNFQFTAQNKPAGEAGFVFRCLRHFFTNPETVEVRRRGQEALAILPYPETLRSKARSALVIQSGLNDEYVAIREQASLLQSGYDYSGMDQQSTGEWDFLLQKHMSTKSDEELPVYGGSQIDQLSISDSEASGTEAMNEAIEDDKQVLDAAHVSKFLDEAIKDCIAEWKEQKLPKLEEKQAWSIWKRTKQSRSIRDGLIAAAAARVQDLGRRLKKLKQELVEREWRSEKALFHSFQNLEVTVEDIEEQKWMITVWQRRKEPLHLRHHANASASHVAQPSTAGNHGPQFAVHPDDRMSVSPTPAIRVQVLENTLEGADHDDEHFHSARGSPVPSASDEGDGFEVSDEMSVDMNDTEQEGLPDAIASDFDSPEDGEVIESPNGITSSPPPRETSVTATPQQSSGRRSLAQIMSDEAAGEDDDIESPGLPPYSSLVTAPIKPQPATPSKQSRTLSNAPIDLTLSSSEPEETPKRKGNSKGSKSSAKRKKEVHSDKPADAEVDSLDYADLARKNDRSRLLVKMLRDAGEKQCNELHQCMLKTKPAFESQLRTALRACLPNNTEAEFLDPRYAEIMQFCAGVAIRWFDPNTAFVREGEQDLPYVQLANDRSQISIFHNLLLNLLLFKSTKLFAAPKASPSKKGANKQEEPTFISSDTEDTPEDTPHSKKRSRPVEFSQSAMISRRRAQNRLQRFQALESQSTDNAQLEQMAGSDAAHLSEIVVNPRKSKDDDFIYIRPKIARKMKEHQIKGVQFLWNEMIAKLPEGEQEDTGQLPEDEQEDTGKQGCLLAHTMGLGKTMQSIAFLTAVGEAFRSRSPRVYGQLPEHLRHRGAPGKRRIRILILCPPALIQNWQREIAEWAGDSLGNVFAIESGNKFMHDYMTQWDSSGGVLLIGYHLFRSMLSEKSKKSEDDSARDARVQSHERILLESPDIVVADEVHTIKSDKSAISKAAKRFRTEVRIGLTGTPMSNDVQEIYSLISWVAPGYLGEPEEFRVRYGEPIKAGTWAESTPYEVGRTKVKLAALRKAVAPKVHRADITVLKGSLKSKVEFVIFVPLTPTQKVVYKKFLAALKHIHNGEKVGQVALFGWLGGLTRLLNHPVPFKRKLLEPRPAKKQKNRDQTPAETDSGATTPLPSIEDDASVAAEQVHDADLYSLGFTEAMVQEMLQDVDDDIDPSRSAKTELFMEILRLSQKCRDKMLVFSSSIPTLNYLDDLLKSQGILYGRIDGSTSFPKRTEMLADFNDEHDETDVMLISTRAGGVGLNITGANRIVIFDFGFNPTWEEQAVGRAYRIGQTKPVYVYRFVAGGTFEMNTYNKQIFKSALASRVVDKKNPKRNAERNVAEWLYDPKDVPQQGLTQWTGKDPKVLDQILARHGINGEDGKVDTKIRKIVTMETLQEEAPEEPLSEEQLMQVNEELQIDKGRLRSKRTATGLASGLAASTANGFIAAQSTMADAHLPASTQFARPPTGQPQAGFAGPSTAPAANSQRNLSGGEVPAFRPLPG